MIEGILWDLDGLLIDTEPIHCASYMEVFKELNLPVSEHEFYTHWTQEGKGVVDFLKNKGSLLDPDMVGLKKREIYQSKIRTEPILIKGAVQTLQYLKNYFPMALATSTYKTNLDIVLSVIDIKQYFSVIVTRDDVKNGKPDPEVFTKAANQLGMLPKYAVVIEDAQKGILAAYRAGAKSIAVPNEYTRDSDFSLADKVVDTLTDITVELIHTL